jgi:gas vesicle protein
MKEELRTEEAGRIPVLVPFLVGGLVGAGIMLLLAPKSGREIRHDISDLAASTRERVVSTLDKGRVVLQEGQTALAEALDAGKTAFIQEKERHRQAA